MSQTDSLPLAGCRVLVIEDMPPMQWLYKSTLLRAGADVTLHCSGYAALAIVTAAAGRGEPFDAILIDLLLEGSNGVSTTRRLRTAGFRGAIIAESAFWTPKLVVEWQAAGCDECLAKPLDLAALPGLIARWVSARVEELNSSPSPSGP